MRNVRTVGLLVAVYGLMQASTSLGAGTVADPRLRAAALTVGVGFVLLAALFSGRVFASLGLPRLTGYLATGILAGPALLRFLPEGTVSGMALVNGVAVALIAVTAGSEMDFRAMRPLLAVIGWISGLAVLGSALVLAATSFALRGTIGFMHDLPVVQAGVVSLVLGVVVVSQSPAVVVALRAETGADGPVARTVLGVVVLADLLVIVLYAVSTAICQAVLEGSADVGETAAGVSWELFGSLAIGTVIGGILSLWMRVVGDRGLDLFVLATCLVVAEVARRIHLDSLLVMLAAGMFVENVSRAGHRLRHAFEDASLPVYMLFFTVAGASIRLDLLPLVAIPAAVLIVVRAASLIGLTALAARLSKAPPTVSRWGGLGLLPQAGLANALALSFARSFPAFGEEASALVLGIIAVNVLIGPALTRWALVRAGESTTRAASTDPSGQTVLASESPLSDSVPSSLSDA